MSISAMKYALDVLDNYVEDPRCETHRATAVHFLEQAIAEAEKQEPVAWREVAGKTTHYYDYNEDGRGEPLYAAPQPDLARVGEVGVWGDKREWVGLTSEEKIAIYKEVDGRPIDLIDAIEAKLKEKNS
jgi:hypothetical protein